MAVLPPHGWRVGCAWVPDFAVTVARLERPHLPADLPVALVEETRSQARVMAACALARAEGVRPGQMASRARARLPALRCLPWDAAALLQAARVLAARLEVASPVVVPLPDSPGWFWVDARGMRWLGGEAGLGARLLAAADAAGFGQLRLAIADAAVTARAAVQVGGAQIGVAQVGVAQVGGAQVGGAQVGGAGAGATRLWLVPPGHDAGFLAGLPLAALDLDPVLVETLSGLGFRRVGEVAALPPSALEARFGPAAREALERALGHDWRRPEGAPTPALPEAVLALESPVADTARLLFGLRAQLDTLAGRLLARGLSATRLALVLRLDDGGEREEVLEPAQPLHHPRPLFELCRDRLERLEVDAPVVELRLVVRAARPSVPEQTHLGATRWDAAALEGVLDRLQGRYGRAVIFTPAPVDDVRPERAGTWVAVTGVPHHLRLGGADPGPPEPLRPVRRLSPRGPEPLAVQTDALGTPQAVWRGGRRRAVVAFGPERLSGGWWGRPFAHEDWRLAGADGEVLWVRRLAADDAACAEAEPSGSRQRAGSGGVARGEAEAGSGPAGPWRLMGWWD